MSFFLALIIVAIVLGLIGTVVSGVGYLLALGVVVFVLDLLYGFMRLRGRRTHR